MIDWPIPLVAALPENPAVGDVVYLLPAHMLERWTGSHWVRVVHPQQGANNKTFSIGLDVEQAHNIFKERDGETFDASFCRSIVAA